MSKLTTHPKRTALIALISGASVVAAVLALLTSGSTRASVATNEGANQRTVAHSDHATFPTLSNLVAASQVVVIGTVKSSTPAAPIPPPEPGAPEISQTDFGVEVGKVVKGAVAVGSTITVDVATSSGDVQVEGEPGLSVGQAYAFFLLLGGDGKYYALAGDTAIAPLGTEGSYTLSADTTGSEGLTFKEADLATGPPDSVSISFPFHREDSIIGDAESGGFLISASAISGTAVVHGHQIKLDLTLNRHHCWDHDDCSRDGGHFSGTGCDVGQRQFAVGRFSIDAVSYSTVFWGLLRSGKDTTATLRGLVRNGRRIQPVKITVHGHAPTGDVSAAPSHDCH